MLLIGAINQYLSWRETKVVFKSFDVDTVYGVTKGWRETKVVFKCDNFT